MKNTHHRLRLAADPLLPALLVTVSLAARSVAEPAPTGPAQADDAQQIRSACRELKIDYPDHGFLSLQPPQRWEDGLIVGNGTTGLLVSGTPLQQSYSIGHEWLFEPRTPPRPLIGLADHLDECRRLALEGRGDQATRLAFRLGQERRFPRILWTNPLVPAGSLQVWTMPPGQSVTACAGAVDWQDGQATWAWRTAAGLFHSRCFASRDDGLLAVDLSSPTGDALHLKLKLARQIDPANVARQAGPDPTITVEPDWLTLARDYRLEKPWRGAVRGYLVVARLVRQGGSARVQDGWTVIDRARRLTVLIAVELFKDRPFDPSAANRLKARLAAVRDDYDHRLARHARLHGRLFDRLHLRLGDGRPDRRSSQALLADPDVDRHDPKRVAKLFHAARYALISSTGQLPPTLQGIWSGTFSPAWSSDFTQDGNVQAVIDSGLCGNFPEVTRAYLDYMTGLQDDFRRNARGLFGCRGLWVPSRTSDFGCMQHFSDRWPGLFWFAGAAWVSAYYYDYWLYTGDRAFLENQALPFMLDAAAFYEDFLTVERDGRLVFVPSFSPEIGPKGKPSVTVNATMTVAAVRQLLRNLLALHETGIARLDPQRLARWRAMLDKMPDYMIDKTGAFKEWLWPGLENNDNHRHASHLYPAWFEVDPALRRSPALRHAARLAIDRRLDYRRKRGGGEMAFGLVQLGLAAAHLRQTDLAYECIRWLTSRYWTAGLCPTHDPGRIFNVDISGGMPAVLIEMLMQSRAVPARPKWHYHIDLLPALPDQWPDGAVTGLRARGGFQVDLTWKNGRLTYALLRSLQGNPCTVTCDGRSLSLETRPGTAYELAGLLRPDRPPGSPRP